MEYSYEKSVGKKENLANVRVNLENVQVNLVN